MDLKLSAMGGLSGCREGKRVNIIRDTFKNITLASEWRVHCRVLTVDAEEFIRKPLQYY